MVDGRPDPGSIPGSSTTPIHLPMSLRVQMNRARYASHRDGQKRCTGGVAQRRRQQTVTLRQGNTGGSSPPATTIRLVANRRIDDSGAFKAVLWFSFAHSI